jgi:hypothetical protein
MASLLIDDSGNLRDSGSQALRAELKAWHLGASFVDYVIRNLGFIAISHSGDSARLQLRPAVTSPAAFGALMQWLTDNAPPRVAVSHLSDRWNHEFFSGAELARQRLMTLISTLPPPRENDFLAAAVAQGAVTGEHPFATLVRLREEARATLRRTAFERLLENKLHNRFLMIEQTGPANDIVITDVGSGHAREANYWLSRQLGRRVEDGPDQAYSDWVAKRYRQAMDGGKPSIEDVDVIVEWPQMGRVRYRYKRLLLPLEAANDRPKLLCTTLGDAGIDLRPKVL